MGQRNSNILKDYNPKKTKYILEQDLKLELSNYPKFGSYHDLETIESIFPKIILWSIENQMIYSNAITRKYALNQVFLNALKINLESSIDDFISKINATTIGNLAFITYYNGINSEIGIHYTKIIKYLKFNFV